MEAIPLEILRKCAEKVGLNLVGVADIAPFVAEAARLQEWQEAGRAGDMKYMQRDPKLLSTASLLLPSIRSLVSFMVPYSGDPAPARTSGSGRVARYAWGRDYHTVLPSLLESFVEIVEQETGGAFEYRIFSDAVPFLERAAAARARLGFIGKNTMLIRPGMGSLGFLAEVLWSLEIDIPELGAESESTGSCGSCSRCLDRCPTNAFVSARVLDSRKCISYLTIEKRNWLDEWEREAIGEWIFGCDVCQEVCPFNHTSIKIPSRRAHHHAFDRSLGVGPLLDLREVLSLKTAEQFRSFFASTPLLRTKRTGLLRNAAVVAANTCAYELTHDLITCVREDPDPVIRGHAVWALGKFALNGEGEGRGVIERARIDDDEKVRMESELALSRLAG